MYFFSSNPQNFNWVIRQSRKKKSIEWKKPQCRRDVKIDGSKTQKNLELNMHTFKLSITSQLWVIYMGRRNN